MRNGGLTLETMETEMTTPEDYSQNTIRSERKHRVHASYR